MHDLILVCGLFVQFARFSDARTPGLTDQESFDKPFALAMTARA
jgi:hypothetical protein